MEQRDMTLVDLLRRRAVLQSEETIYTFLQYQKASVDEEYLTYGELDRKVRQLGAYLQSIGAEKHQVLLIYPPGLDYIIAFFACLYAGAVAVPAYPPQFNRLELQNRTLSKRFLTILRDAEPVVALTTGVLAAKIAQVQIAELQEIHWVATSDLTSFAEDVWVQPAISAETLAFLQYTSGSTSDPKGVMLTHGNLLHNLAIIQSYFRHDETSKGVIWLPPYHDMGLIGGILQPLYVGFPVVLLSPLAFLQRPVRWLEAISRYQATTSGGPNFAYDLCLQKVMVEERAMLDLSSWRVAFNGAEPIRSATLHAFAETFAECGFQPEALLPSYGLAEATLIVSGNTTARFPHVLTLDSEALQQHNAVLAKEQEQTTSVVSSGAPALEQTLLVVDPVTLVPCNEQSIGEVWVAGGSVASGYWQKDVQSRETFQAVTASGAGPFLRTGDLGFLHENELYITGRLRDLIIIRGRNYYPQDIELSLEEVHPKLRANCAAAFSVSVGGEEKLVVVCEIERTHRQSNFAQLMQSIRQTIAQEYALELYQIVLLKAGGVPKTSSGKIQRSACRARLLAGELPLLAESTLDIESQVLEDVLEEALLLTRSSVLELVHEQRQQALARYLQASIASILQMSVALPELEQPLTALGLDSLKAVELQYHIQRDLECDLALDRLLAGTSLTELAVELLFAVEQEQIPATISALQSVADLSLPQPLSPGQNALWFLQQLASTSAAYNVARVVRIQNACDSVSLAEAFHRLVLRHPALRTTFMQQGGELKQQFHEVMDCFRFEDATYWDDQKLRERLAKEAHQTFDLTQGPLFHVWAFARSAQETILLFVGHHLILDFWSLTILLHELGIVYQDVLNGKERRLPALALNYADYVQWQHRFLHEKRGETLWRYWQQELAGELPVLNFPLEKPRFAVQTYNGAAQTLSLSAALTDQLKHLSLQENVTLYMLLLAAFQVLLSRYCGQEDILLGSLTNGRTQSQLKDIVGYFVNPLVLRADLSGNPSFLEYLARTRAKVLAAFAHQDFPFATLVERLQPVRDPGRSPLFQVMFVWQNTPFYAGLNLTSLALNTAGASLQAGPLMMETLELDQYTTQFDLTLAMGECDGRLQASFQYNSDLFSQAMMLRLLSHFETLLEGILAQPAAQLAELPLMHPSEQAYWLALLRGTSTEYDRTTCIHTLFEACVERQPEATAVVYQDGSLTYANLNARANQLAWYLRKLGVGAETRVGICLERSLDLLVGLLGILKAGGTYIPLDPTYPVERLHYISDDAAFPIVVTAQCHAVLFRNTVQLVCIDSLRTVLDSERWENLTSNVSGSNAAYVIYTSGSTGKPKGVIVEHRNVVNFFAGMDERVGCGPQDTLLALTSISFDISVLELFWTLTRGAKVVLLGEQALFEGSVTAPLEEQNRASEKIDFSLFYFANEEAKVSGDRYRLLLEGARFADQHNFHAIWTPERHFHSFGGLYPNPSVISAALATITHQLRLRAGSVVLPLHNPLRVAEEWSVVDNLSNGRVGLAFASGWHSNDFVYFPENYTNRKQIMFENIAVVRGLWEGQGHTLKDGSGKEISVKISPPPIQSTLPIWITAAGSNETFIKAGEIGANILTHLLGQSIEDVTRKFQLYREARARAGFDPESGQVTLMLHTFVGPDEEIVRQKIRQPFINYLRTSLDLIENLIRTLNLPLDLKTMSTQDMDDLLAFAVDRYYETSALFGTPERCLKMIHKLKSIGVNEVACLIDFGIDTKDVLESLASLDTLRELANAPQKDLTQYTLTAQALRYQPTLLQCTPSAIRLTGFDEQALTALTSLRRLLLGGEALPTALAKTLQERLSVEIENMYGPTETTVWSATYPTRDTTIEDTVPLGYPIVNTQLAVLDQYLHLVPPGVAGEIYIGGAGLSRGYLGRPDLTAERFYSDPFSPESNQRLYRTGDLGRYRADGVLEFLGRVDQQVKIRGFRIELGEIESALAAHPDVSGAVVSVSTDKQLVAYLVPGVRIPDHNELRTFLKGTLPDYMLPASFVMVHQLPLTANGKIDRNALASLEGTKISSTDDLVKPRNQIEQIIADIWCQVLNIEQVGIHDNFFDIGGHSLLIAQVHVQLRSALNRDIPLVKLLEHSTIDLLAHYLQTLDDGQQALQQSVDRARLQREFQLRRLQRLQS